MVRDSFCIVVLWCPALVPRMILSVTVECRTHRRYSWIRVYVVVVVVVVVVERVVSFPCVVQSDGPSPGYDWMDCPPQYRTWFLRFDECGPVVRMVVPRRANGSSSSSSRPVPVVVVVTVVDDIPTVVGIDFLVGTDRMAPSAVDPPFSFLPRNDDDPSGDPIRQIG